MNTKKIGKVMVLCMVFGVMISLVVGNSGCADSATAPSSINSDEPARAQGRNDPNAGSDKTLANKHGMQVFDKGDKVDGPKKPSNLQKTIGFASIFVAIAVVKWL